jgi:UDP-N-acetylmuramyl pentapeptide phosphotransferase/UDP-N-acetylglucosamine-1-phosphate transferase
MLQTLAVVVVIFALPPDLHAVPFVQWWIERALIIVGGLWFINLVNFTDGLDRMTVAELVPITAALAAIGLLGVLSAHTNLVSLAFCGAVIGFAWFNRPVARLFLSDVDGVPIGLLLGWLVLVAGSGGRAAAILLPLYYLANSPVAIIHRFRNGERIATVIKPSRELDIAALAEGAVLVAWLLLGFARGRRRR